MLRSRCLSVCLVAASLGAGCDDSTPLGDTLAGRADQQLTDGLRFEGGTVIEAAVPSTTNAQVRIEPLEQTLIVSPGQTGTLALTVRSPIEDTDPVEATVVRFGDDPRHMVVTRRPGASAADIENDFIVDTDVCSTLCQRSYSTTVVEAARTSSGEIGAYSERTVVLDCSTSDVRECSAEENAATEMDASSGVTAGSAQWSAMLLADLRAAASDAWQQNHGCADPPQHNDLADGAAAELIAIGVDTYSSDDFQALGPDPIAGTWQSIAFSAGEEAMAVEAAGGYGGEVAFGMCDSTSLGIHIEPNGGRFTAGLVWLQCVQCGGVCAMPASPACTDAGM